MLRTFLRAAGLALALGACAERQEAAEAPAAPAAPLALCEAFAATTSAADLAERFGPANVQDAIIEGGEGARFPGAKLFPGDPAREVEITWHDPIARRGVASAAIYAAESRWIGPGGVRIGSTLNDVQQANGQPFQLFGFGWDYGGAVADWGSGALGGECRLIAILEPAADTAGEALGERLFASDDPAMRAAEPRVAMIAVGWPPPTVSAPEPPGPR